MPDKLANESNFALRFSSCFRVSFVHGRVRSGYNVMHTCTARKFCTRFGLALQKSETLFSVLLKLNDFAKSSKSLKDSTGL